MHYAFLISLLLFAVTSALANTEIANFEVTQDRNFDIWFVRQWPSLNYTDSVLHYNLTANPLGTPRNEVNKGPCTRLYHWTPETTPEKCLQELWIALEHDDENWLNYDKFTLRLSYSASVRVLLSSPPSLLYLHERKFPVKAYLKIFDASDIAPLPRPGPPRRFRNRRMNKYHVRRKFARIQLVNTGVLNPKSELAESGQDPTTLPGPVPIIVRLEPLMFGVIPQSVIPTIFALAGAVVVGTFVARAMVGRLRGEAEQYAATTESESKEKDE
ncbi:hypothetical protein EST38_g1320 [Candolleomyces aberdarensis]|uniref:Uncharacterized protein n=1 Tax=Candolleomyces aberdarensis TaxID=2316362 RepID=A0A4V1Q572_9AGAR|nr:hypothetical protein EST38_g1320 [Candolleomyces aberdarensis]